MKDIHYGVFVKSVISLMRCVLAMRLRVTDCVNGVIADRQIYRKNEEFGFEVFLKT